MMCKLELAEHATSFVENLTSHLSWLAHTYFISIKPHAPRDGDNEFKEIISNMLLVDEVP